MANEKRFDLINRGELLDAEYLVSMDGALGYVVDSEIVRRAKRVDAVEVVHGRWVFGEIDVLGQPVHCSVCGWGRDKVNKAMWLEYPAHKYCGCCGAKMDGDGNA